MASIALEGEANEVTESASAHWDGPVLYLGNGNGQSDDRTRLIRSDELVINVPVYLFRLCMC